MINYDIPWNPNRLEQRRGRIHRYGQEKDCLISNFVSVNTREGRVLEKLFDRIEQIENDLDPNRTGKVFNVLGDVFPANQLERMLREMYARNLTEAVIKDRIVKEVDTDRLRRITESTLEGLAKRDLNLSAIVGKSEEAKERRLVPEVIEDFFVHASPLAGLTPRPDRTNEHIYRVGRLPRTVLPYGDRLEPQFGKLGREYRQIVFDKELLTRDPTLEWVTPGHPLFECVREFVQDQAQGDLQRGTVFYDLHRTDPAKLDVFSAEIRDGLGHVLHKRLFVTHTSQDGTIDVRQPTIFLDLSLAPKGTDGSDRSDRSDRSHREAAEAVLHRQALLPLLDDVRREREREVRTLSEHLEISLNTIVDRAQVQFAELLNQKEARFQETGLDGRIKILEDKLDELNTRLEQRRADLEKEQQCTISNIQHLGAAWVLPHPERDTPSGRLMVSDPEIEWIAVEAVASTKKLAAGASRASSRRTGASTSSPGVRTPKTPTSPSKCVSSEVKGRAHVGEVALTTNEYKTAQRLKKDFWLYVVFNCADVPEVHPLQDPVRLGWESVVTVEHYHVGANEILKSQPPVA